MEKLKKSGKYDDVFKHFESVAARPKIKEYMAGDRRLKYSDGIWRHYPELEEDE
jgi:glutathione S-transferase